MTGKEESSHQQQEHFHTVVQTLVNTMSGLPGASDFLHTGFQPSLSDEDETKGSIQPSKMNEGWG